ncbi:uncharacterized protein LOC120779866 [Bactrocera tryoni]|uniref:uncharacterized protein LOC120779866 n=1 Tax=Bactrocera tryoni TaxID=59916 RepID=UPI001A978D57|nr:uncharacterized protein LOC120779866 [Bactrocera tryoni]
MTTNGPTLTIADAVDEAQSTASIVAVSSCKLPQFWSIQPRLWFVQVEAVLQVARITNDASRYNQIVSALDPDAMLQLADFLQNPPGTDKYAKLKDEILKRFSESSDRQLHRALTEISKEDVSSIQPRHAQLRATTGALDAKYLQLLNQFIDITHPSTNPVTATDSQVAHHIETTGPPVFERPRRLTGEKLQIACLGQCLISFLPTLTREKKDDFHRPSSPSSPLSPLSLSSPLSR